MPGAVSSVRQVIDTPEGRGADAGPLPGCVLAVGLNTYTHDFDVMYPNHVWRWNGVHVAKYNYIFQTWGISTGFYANYASPKPDLYYCPLAFPTLKPGHARLKSYERWPNYSGTSILYSYFAGVDEDGVNRRRGPSLVNDVMVPSRTTVIGDCARFDPTSSDPFSTIVYWNHNGDLPWSGAGTLVEQASVNCAYVDGHVTLLTQRDQFLRHAQPMAGDWTRSYVAEQPDE